MYLFIRLVNGRIPENVTSRTTRPTKRTPGTPGLSSLERGARAPPPLAASPQTPKPNRSRDMSRRTRAAI